MNRLTVGRSPRGGAGSRGWGSHGRGSSVILQKANAHLRGQRVARPEPDEPDEGDIGAYLSSLSRKTKEPQWDKFGESDLDISMSSDEQAKKAAPITASKFLKKKTEIKENQNAIKLIKKPTVSGAGITGSSMIFSKSSALNKAAAFVSKFSERPQKAVVNLSDSDLDMDLSMDSDIAADVRAIRQSPQPSQPAPKPTTPVRKANTKLDAKAAKKRPASAKSSVVKAESPSLADESISIGVDGSKFTKTSKVYGNYDISDSSTSDLIGKGGSVFLKKPKAKSSPPPKERIESPDSPKRQSMFRLKSSEKHASQVQLDTDEESLADFIGGLSSSTEGTGSARTPRSSRSPRSPISGRQATTSKFLKSKLSPVSRPSPEPLIDTIREVDEEDDSIKPEKDDDEDDSFRIKVFELDDLEPVVELEPSRSSLHGPSKRSPKKSSIPKSPKEKSHKTKNKKGEKKKEKKSKGQSGGASDIFTSMGLQTVEDLMGDVSGMSDVVSEVEEELGRLPTPLRSILSPTPRSDYTPRRVRLALSEVMEIRSRSPSPDPISTARAITSRIYTEDWEDEGDYSESAASICTSDVSETESVRTMTESSQSMPSRSEGQRLTRQRSDEYYSDDFTETSAVSRRCYMHSSSQTGSDRGSDTATSYSEDYTSYVHDSGRSRTPSPRSPRRSMRSIRVQTAEVPGLWYGWSAETAGMAGMTPPYGLHNVDPIPIATHVVKADALEALTAYSPSVLALNDLLREQLHLTQTFIDAQRRLHKAYVGVSVPDHQYTTLQGTKEYIMKHRKPKLTFDEALRQVKEEMGLE